MLIDEFFFLLRIFVFVFLIFAVDVLVLRNLSGGGCRLLKARFLSLSHSKSCWYSSAVYSPSNTLRTNSFRCESYLVKVTFPNLLYIISYCRFLIFNTLITLLFYMQSPSYCIIWLDWHMRSSFWEFLCFIIYFFSFCCVCLFLFLSSWVNRIHWWCLVVGWKLQLVILKKKVSNRSL